MSESVIHALVLIQNWEDDGILRRSLVEDRHVASLFHIMGRHSYLIDANFDDKSQYIETQEVVTVLKYRNRVLDEHGHIRMPVDRREIYTL